MTWKALAALLAAVAMATGCALPSVSRPSAAGAALPGEHCADLLAAALSSPNAPVSGAYACQSPSLITDAQGSGVNTDADIQGVARSQGFTSALDLGGASGVFTYLLGGPSATDVLVVWTDSNGLVVLFQKAAHP